MTASTTGARGVALWPGEAHPQSPVKEIPTVDLMIGDMELWILWRHLKMDDSARTGQSEMVKKALTSAPICISGSWKKSEDERKEYISRQLHLYKSQSNSILKFMKGSTNLTSASLSIDHSIAQHGKALSEGEFIKKTPKMCTSSISRYAE
ncbi:hypothetical protein QTO34_016658 [Cnephaeus nilssonii]|uniref:Uncharacterized protein n=1 Tax=Cnephaeus nilssonii TaxID=3371016 RepID=A0AA40I3J8_CNENI|nr:hypothetical protein QTO34_016658 [Eptesicus nilssonii]